MFKERYRILYYITVALFIVYVLFLVWVILFKMEFSLSRIEHVRTYNLIPFYYEQNQNSGFHHSEVRNNILAFIPLGIYLSSLFPKQGFMRRAAIIFAFSLALECSQFALAVGRFDITDLITNTIGGIAGAGICLIIYSLIRDKAKGGMIAAIPADVLTILAVGVMVLMLLLN